MEDHKTSTRELEGCDSWKRGKVPFPQMLPILRRLVIRSACSKLKPVSVWVRMAEPLDRPRPSKVDNDAVGVSRVVVGLSRRIVSLDGSGKFVEGEVLLANPTDICSGLAFAFCNKASG